MRKQQLKVGEWYAWLPDHLELWYGTGRFADRYVKQVKVLAHNVQRTTVSDYAESYYRNDGIRIVQQGNDPETQSFVTHARRFLMPWPEFHAKHQEALAEREAREAKAREEAALAEERHADLVRRATAALEDTGITVGDWGSDADLRIDTDGEVRLNGKVGDWDFAERFVTGLEVLTSRMVA